MRHGQTEFNLQGIYQGQVDSPLTEEGEAQARALAPRLAALQPCPTIYTSDLGRTVRTAELLAGQGQRIVADPGLRERDFGLFQGLRKAQIPTLHPDEWAAHITGDPDYVVPGGESQRQMQVRVVAAIERIAERHPDERVIVVSHGGALGVWFKHVLGLPIEQRRHFDVGNTSLSIAYREPDGWMLRTLGELAHLSGLEGYGQQAEG